MLGAVVGTITYMSPEQARGEPVDQRADLYALGLIISDMLLGLARRSGISADDDLVRRMVKRPDPLRDTNPGSPEALDRIVTRLVEPDPKARFQTTAELVAALKRLDDNGVPLPLIQRLTPRLIATAATVVIALLAATFYFNRGSIVAPVHHDPVSVVVADFQNTTGDATFDGVIESTVKRALEGAGFVAAYDRIALRNSVGVDAPAKFDEAAARDVATQQGLGIGVAGTIAPQGSGYALSIKAVQVADGNVIATSDRNADSKDNVVAAATRLAAAVRTALGDEAKESVQLAAMPSLSATPFSVLREYVDSLKAPSTGTPEDARRYLDVMTEREKFRTRGAIAQSSGDYQQCVKEYGDLIKQFEAEVVGRYQRAQCLAELRDMDGALTDMRHVVESLPGRMLFHTTLARYATYAGDVAIAEEEAGKLPPDSTDSQRLLAMSQVGQDLLAEATGAYEKLRAMKPVGASFAVVGLGDIAIAQGRFTEAARILEQGSLADLKSGNAEAAASEYALLAYAELSRGRNQLAVVAAEKALAASQSVKIRFLAARTMIEAGAADKARRLIDALAAGPHADAQAHAKILEGELALKNGDPREAIKLLTAANSQLDTWIGRFELGRANFAAGAYVQADSEIDRCIKRRGEALSLFIDEDPSFGYFPAVYFYKGQIREALKNAGFTESYKKYLAYRGESKDDPLVAEVRKKAGS
jgi:tetratricopeptide (TPR) repeat protein